ncbi:MAG: hypothetical protein NTW87_25985 [Planctomycetota bacterium]|nr:hypothetical protein [Planctomycetota bacterium]
MRFATQLTIVALLALPVGTAFAGTTDHVTVTINVSLDLSASLDIVFTDDTVNHIWNVAGATPGTSHLASAATPAVQTAIKNRATISVNLSVKATATNGWSPFDPNGTDTFKLVATPPTGSTPGAAVTLTTSNQTYENGLAGGASDAAGSNLKLDLPTAVTAHSTSVITVTYTATATP